MARQAVDRATFRVVHPVDVLRRQMAFDDDVRLEVFHAHPLEFVHDHRSVLLEQSAAAVPFLPRS